MRSFCHSVVHWNVRANPVDLAQSEGRGHRHEGHAAYRNVAVRHGSAVLRRSLAAYRLVVGQPRQDDLMAYLLVAWTSWTGTMGRS